MPTPTQHREGVDADRGGLSLAGDWTARNQACLASSLDRVRLRLEVGSNAGAREADEGAEDSVLALMTVAFGLSPFERDVLLLAAGIELSSEFARACAEAQSASGAANGGPTF